MALSKKSITGLGTVMSIAIIAVSGFFVVKPSYEQAQENVTELETMKVETQVKQTRLQTLEEGVDDYDDILAFVDRFLLSAPADEDIESASRAISDAVTPGIQIQSFTFGAPEPTSDYPVPEASLERSEPDSLDAGGSDASDAGGASAGTFQRVPVQVTVSATSYAELSVYLDALANQNRLLTVLDVSGTNSTENVTATINGYAFIYAR